MTKYRVDRRLDSLPMAASVRIFKTDTCVPLNPLTVVLVDQKIHNGMYALVSFPDQTAKPGNKANHKPCFRFQTCPDVSRAELSRGEES